MCAELRPKRRGGSGPRCTQSIRLNSSVTGYLLRPGRGAKGDAEFAGVENAGVEIVAP